MRVWKDEIIDISELISDLEDSYPECEVVGIPLPIYFTFSFLCVHKNDIKKFFQ